MRSNKAGESGHFVRTISLRCYEILMQLFMLSYSWRNAVVHPCKTFPIYPLWSVGEGTNMKIVFFLLKNLMCNFWSFSPCTGDPFNGYQWKTKWTEGLLKLTKFGVATFFIGIYSCQQYLEKQTKYSNPLRRRHFAAKKRPAGDALAFSECICVSSFPH